MAICQQVLQNNRIFDVAFSGRYDDELVLSSIQPSACVDSPAEPSRRTSVCRGGGRRSDVNAGEGQGKINAFTQRSLFFLPQALG